MHTPKSLTGYEPRVFAERVMRVDSVLLGSRELSHSRVWFKLDHLDLPAWERKSPHPLRQVKPASVATSEARIRCGRRSPHPLRQVKPASVAAKPASAAAGNKKKSKPASVRQVKPASVAAEARIHCGRESPHPCGRRSPHPCGRRSPHPLRYLSDTQWITKSLCSKLPNDVYI